MPDDRPVLYFASSNPICVVCGRAMRTNFVRKESDPIGKMTATCETPGCAQRGMQIEFKPTEYRKATA